MFEANKRVLLHENSSIRFTQAYIHKHTCISLYIISIGDRESEAKRERPSTSKAYHITTPFLLHILIRIKAAIIPRSIIWFSEHWTLICRGKYCSKKTSFNSWKTFLSLPPHPPPDAVFEIKNSYPLLPFIGTRSNSTTRENFRIDIPEDEVGGCWTEKGAERATAFRLAGGGTELWVGWGHVGLTWLYLA